MLKCLLVSTGEQKVCGSLLPCTFAFTAVGPCNQASSVVLLSGSESFTACKTHATTEKPQCQRWGQRVILLFSACLLLHRLAENNLQQHLLTRLLLVAMGYVEVWSPVIHSQLPGAAGGLGSWGTAVPLGQTGLWLLGVPARQQQTWAFICFY